MNKGSEISWNRRTMLYGMASPLLRQKRNLPLYLILQGDADELTPLRYAQIFHEQIVESGGNSILKELTGANHGFGYESQQSRREHVFVKLIFFYKAWHKASNHRRSLIYLL